MSKVRVGIIGCGSIARYRHLPEYTANPNAEVVAICDIKPGRAEKRAKQFDVPNIYSDYKELLARTDLDVVSVCTPNYLHAPMTIDVLNSGRHCLCEKPLATSKEEAEAMIAAAKKNGKFLMVDHNQRLAPAHVKGREILASGELGKVLSFQTTFGHSGPQSWSADGGVSWFFRKEQAFIGAMGDLGIHKADLMRYLLGEEIVKVAAFFGTLDPEKIAEPINSTVDDNALFILQMASGALGQLTVSWSYKTGEDNSTVIRCDKGTLRLFDDPKFSVIVEKADGERAYMQVGKMQSNDEGGQTSTGVIDYWIDHILRNEAPGISGEEGYKSLKVVLGAIESAATGKVVDLAKF